MTRHPLKYAISSVLMLSTGLMFQASAVADGPLEEVIVTAQKRDQALSDVPIAISVISDEQFERSGGNGIESLLLSVPGLTSRGNVSPRARSLFLRGVGTISFSIASEPSVGTVIDGVALAASGNAFSDMYDVERIEVLRGPQGTLFGKNSSAGLIQIISKGPTEEFEGYVSGSLFEDDYHKASASVSGPLSENLRGRLNGYYNSYGGNIENENLNKTVNGLESHGFRGQLEWTPNQDVSVKLSADYSEYDNSGAVRMPISGAVNNTTGVIGEPGINAEASMGDIFDGFDQRTVRDNLPSEVAGENFGFALNTEVDLGSSGALTSITAFRKYTVGGPGASGQTTDQDGLPGAILVDIQDVNNFQNTDYTTFSQELRLDASIGEKFEYTAGAYIYSNLVDRFFSRLSVRCNVATGAPTANGAGSCPEGASLPYATNFAGLADYSNNTQLLTAPDDFQAFQTAFDPTIFSANTSIMNVEADMQSYALFGQGTWHLSEKMRVIAGLRATKDVVSFDFRRSGALVNDGANAPAADAFGNAEKTFGGVRVEPLVLNDRESTEYLSGKAVLQYDLTDDIVGYVSYARGYKGPGFNAFFNLRDGQQGPISKETSDYYEIGLRNMLLENKLMLNITAYTAEFMNFQTNALVILDGVNTTTFTNAGDITTEGVDVDFVYRPVENFTINGGYAFNVAEVGSFVTNPVTGQTSAEAGTVLPFAPEQKYSLGFTWDIPTTALNFQLFGNISYTDEQFSNLGERQSEMLPEYTVGNIGLSATTKDDRLKVSLLVQNVGDETVPRYRNNIGGPAGGTGNAILIDMSSERLFGATVKWSF